MYALDTISFPGFCGSYEEINGWSQSHYVDFIVKHHVNHFRFQSLFYSIYGAMQNTIIMPRGVAAREIYTVKLTVCVYYSSYTTAQRLQCDEY